MSEKETTLHPSVFKTPEELTQEEKAADKALAAANERIRQTTRQLQTQERQAVDQTCITNGGCRQVVSSLLFLGGIYLVIKTAVRHGAEQAIKASLGSS